MALPMKQSEYQLLRILKLLSWFKGWLGGLEVSKKSGCKMGVLGASGNPS